MFEYSFVWLSEYATWDRSSCGGGGGDVTEINDNGDDVFECKCECDDGGDE